MSSIFRSVTNLFLYLTRNDSTYFMCYSTQYLVHTSNNNHNKPSQSSFVRNNYNQQQIISLIEQRRSRNENEGNINGIVSHVRGSKQNTTARWFIDNECHNSKQVLKLIESEQFNGIPFDTSVYGKAMQRCNQFGDWRSSLRIFYMINEMNIVMDVYKYNIILDVLAKNRKIKIANQIYHQLSTDRNVKPDVKIFNTLISGCKHQNNVKLPEKYFNDMQEIYNLKPDSFTLNAMITVYGKANMIHKAEMIWAIICNANVNPRIQDCTAMMNIYCDANIEQKMLEIKDFMINEYGYKLSIIQYSVLVKYYVRIKYHEKALDIYYEAANNGITFDAKFIQLISIIFYQLLENEVRKNEYKDRNKCDEYYSMIADVIPNKYPLLIGLEYYRLQFRAALLLYKIDGWTEDNVVRLYDKMLSEKRMFGFWIKENKRNEWMIDLHGCELRSGLISFALRYIFVYHQHLIRQMSNIIVICGKGTNKMGNNQHIANGVMNELKSWPNKIKCKQHKDNKSLLLLNKSDVKNAIKEINDWSYFSECKSITN